MKYTRYISSFFKANGLPNQMTVEQYGSINNVLLLECRLSELSRLNKETPVGDVKVLISKREYILYNKLHNITGDVEPALWVEGLFNRFN